MSSANNNVTHIKGYQHSDRQHLIDDIGARAFLFLRDSAQEKGIPMKDLVVEHMLGLAMVTNSVEGRDFTVNVLQHIISQIENSDAV